MYILLNNLIGGARTSDKEKPHEHDKKNLKKLATFVNLLNDKFAAIHAINTEDKEIKIKYNKKCYKVILITEHDIPTVGTNDDNYFKCRIKYINDNGDQIIIPWHLSIYSTKYNINLDAKISYVHITRETREEFPHNRKMVDNYNALSENTKLIVDEINKILKNPSRIYFDEYTIEDIIETLKNNVQLNRLLYSFSSELSIKKKFDLSNDNTKILELEEFLFKEGIIHILLEFNEKININRINTNKEITTINKNNFKKENDKIKDDNDLRYKINKNKCALKTETYNELIKNNFECYLEDEEYYNTNQNFNDLKKRKETKLTEEKKGLDTEIISLKKKISDKQIKIKNLKIDYEENKLNKQFLNKSTDFKNTLTNLSLWSIKVLDNEENINTLDKNSLFDSSIIECIESHTNIKSLDEKDDFLTKFDSNKKNELIIDNNKLLIVNKELKKILKNKSNIKYKNNFNSFYFIYKKPNFKIIFKSNNFIEYSEYLDAKFNNNSVLNSYNYILSKSLTSSRSKKTSIPNSIKSLENKTFNSIKNKLKQNKNYLDNYINNYITKYVNNYKKKGKYDKISDLKGKIDEYKKKIEDKENEYDNKIKIIVNNILSILYKTYLKLIIVFPKLIKKQQKEDIKRLLTEDLEKNTHKYNLMQEDYDKIIDNINKKITDININNALTSENNTFLKHANTLLEINDDDTNFYTTYDIIIFTLTSQEQKIVKQNKKANKKVTDFYIELVKTKDNAKFENTDKLLQEILSLFIEIINNDYMNKIEENKKDLTQKLEIYKVNISELKKEVNILKEKKKKLENIIQNEPELNEKYYNEVNKIYEKLDRKT